MTTVMIAAAAALTTVTAAGAAVRPHSGQSPVRILLHERFIRKIALAPARKAAPARKTAPSLIDIPAIGVAARLLTLTSAQVARGPAGALLPVPPLTRAADAGWYQFTARPGTLGNAVIVGHVDTYLGPGVFYDLYLLRPGNAIYVGAGRTRQRFSVTSVREVSKSSFPVNQVFGATDRHTLWLITCGGPFDYQTRHYLDNIVVSAIWQPAKYAAKRKVTESTVRLARHAPRVTLNH